MQHRNPVELLGEPPRCGYTKLYDEVIRDGGHQHALGSDGFLVLCYLLSRGSGWETSAVQITEQYGWGRNRARASAALQRIVKDRRLVIRDLLREDGRRARHGYVLFADGRQFSDAELSEYGAPIALPTKGCTATVQPSDDEGAR